MNEGLPGGSMPDPPTAEQPLVPELEGYRAGFRWAKGEIRNLTASIDPATYNARPSEKAWSAAECVEHLSATAREMIPALDAGVAFVNAIPVFIASDPVWAQKFVDAGLPIIGDDIKSQVGATITHRQLARLFEDRGVKIDNTYQLNFGGNMDFMNMLERERLESKKISKTPKKCSKISKRIWTK